MRKEFGHIIVIAALVMVFTCTGQIQAYEVTGDVTSGWGTRGGNLWYDVLKETSSSTAGGYDGTYERGVLGRPPTTKDLPNILNPTNHNWTEVDYILVTGRNGHRALYSVGEIDPRFGNKAVTLTPNKFKKDYTLAGLGRVVDRVSTIEVVHAFTNLKGVVVDGSKDVHPYTPMLVVSGVGIKPRTYDLAALQAMEQVIFDASLSTSNTFGIWSGPTLLDVLDAAGVDTKDMDSYIIVQSSDGYATLLSMYEVAHNTGACPLPSVDCPLPFLAISGYYPDTGKIAINNGSCTDAESAGTTCKDSGFVRFAIPDDWQAGRWVSNTAQIIVFKLDHEHGWCHHPW